MHTRLEQFPEPSMERGGSLQEANRISFGYLWGGRSGVVSSSLLPTKCQIPSMWGFRAPLCPTVHPHVSSPTCQFTMS